MNDDLNLRVNVTEANRGAPGPAQRKPVFSLPAAIAAIVLLTLAALSGTLAWQMPAQLPPGHPWLKTLCAAISCEWLQTAPSYQTVRLKDMRLVQHGSTLIFSGSLINDAGTRPWPSLQLSLYGIDGRVRHRYKLAASDYLRGKSAQEPTPAKLGPATHPIWFSVEAPGAAASYSIEFKPPPRSS